MGLAATMATIAIAWAIHRPRLGTALFAIHDEQDVAEVLGVPTLGCKMAAFAVSCALAGVAGRYVSTVDLFRTGCLTHACR